jgi:hypothetical protein
LRQLISNPKVIEQGFNYKHKSLSAAGNGVRGSVWSLDGNVANSEVMTLQFWNGNCKDLVPSSDPEQYESHRLLLRSEMEQVKDQTYNTAELVEVQNCSSLVSFCSADNLLGQKARWICPETCGCNDPSASLVFISLVHGMKILA